MRKDFPISPKRNARTSNMSIFHTENLLSNWKENKDGIAKAIS